MTQRYIHTIGSTLLNYANIFVDPRVCYSACVQGHTMHDTILYKAHNLLILTKNIWKE